MADDNLEPLASIADLAVKTGASTDDEKLKLALRLASGRFREQTNNPISMVTETVVLDSDGGRALTLPCLPVRDVSELQIDGESVSDFEWSAMGAIRLDRPIPTVGGACKSPTGMAMTRCRKACRMSCSSRRRPSTRCFPAWSRTRQGGNNAPIPPL